MTQAKVCDRDSDLRRYLDDRLTTQQQREVEQHLTGCRSCQRRIEELVGQPEEWRTAIHLLSTDAFDANSIRPGQGIERSGPLSLSPAKRLINDPSSVGESSTTRDSTMLIREIQGWLDATDDPRAMGRFAGYEIVGIIGHGGMGIVLKGFEASLNRFVAIKVLAPRLAMQAVARQRFAREGRAAAAVIHENVISIHRVDEWHGLPYLVMPYVAGESLQQRLDKEGALSLETILRIGAQVAAGLAAAHAQGLVHRDIKPANILLEPGLERVRITDFGLARTVDDVSLTRSGVIAGTPQYMSPEQVRLEAIDPRSDLFSLGTLLHAMATGQPPFRGESSEEVLRNILDAKTRDLRRESHLPEWFVQLVHWLQQPQPKDRPHSALEVQRVINECQLHVQRPSRLLPRELIGRGRRRMGAWFGLKIVLLALMIAGVTLGSFRLWPRTDSVMPPSETASEGLPVRTDESDAELVLPLWQVDQELSRLEDSIEELERDFSSGF